MSWFKDFWKNMPPDQGKFTPRAQQAMALAQKEAERLKHNFVGTEHLLLGLIKLGQGVAVNVLQKMGFDLEAIRGEVEKQVATGTDQKINGRIPYTPRVKKVLALADTERTALNHKYLGTEHILLGLLREGDGVAARILHNMDVNIEKTRQEILKELDPHFELPAAEAEGSPLSGQDVQGVLADVDLGHFSPHAQQALALARSEADRLNHSFVGTEHLLLGIIKLGKGTAFTVLQKMGLKLDTVRMEIEKRLEVSPAREEIGNIAFTPRAKEVLAMAAKEAKSLSHAYVGTEHILLALLCEGDNAATQVLKALDLHIEETRQEVLKERDPNCLRAATETATSPLKRFGPIPAAARPAARSQAPSAEQGSNFTPRAQQALANARKEAEQFNHNYVGTEHLLLGLITLGQGVAVHVLGKLGVNLETARAEVERQAGNGPDQKVIGNIPYTPRVKKVLALAAREARALNHTFVGTEHILLGLLQDADGRAAKVLKALKVDAEKISEEILRELNPNFPAEPARPTTHSPDSMSNFTPRAQQTLALARKEADQFNHNFVGTEHLLLGLIRLGQGTAVNVLRKMGLDLESVRLEVEKHVGTGPDQKMIGNIPYTPRVKKVLALAAKEAKALNHTYVGTEHILLGLLREGDGVAARVLKNLNLDIEATRWAILQELDPNFQASSQDSGEATPAEASGNTTKAKPMAPKLPFGSVDTNARYDVYCRESNAQMVVYRNALFKDTRSLFARGDWDAVAHFIELEQSNGQTIFIARHSVVRFCLPGAKMEGEIP